jgi:hypothetical protein|uniref:Uncharacterized protein n=1 Tax=Podoviridae sp. ctdDI2 TaxID=2826567 RepID=A0A8S5NR24_9CAUD|nr:MAG TPA: hypothetical protein [Podoviridae sp. ctdDI2]
MPAIDKKESLRKLADIAEDMGFRVWFDFKQCHIHEMYGKEIAWFDLDDQNRFWIDGAFLVASRGRYFREICNILGTFVQEPGRQTRGTLYAVSNSVGPWGRIKELPDASGVEWLNSDSMRSLYTLKGAKRITRRYDLGDAKIVPVFDNDYEGAGAYADDLTKTGGENAPRVPSDNDDSSGQNNQNSPGGNNNNFFRMNF